MPPIPMSKATLQGLKYEEEERLRRHRVENITNEICNAVVSAAKKGETHYLANTCYGPAQGIQELIYREVIKNFPDCEVELGPMGTYILVDWS